MWNILEPLNYSQKQVSVIDGLVYRRLLGLSRFIANIQLELKILYDFYEPIVFIICVQEECFVFQSDYFHQLR